ncbi:MULTISPECIES: hypothetical protein [unclassified Halomonas]|uniref:hypothetical protein n=1 Tax=unclassified Halomonas TaxID=2609666 RepID=UPI0028845BCF|nr:MULTISPECIES: hypothetical protein [unclassified Halomonas]MDT0501606.1 hypothetical protein [Halomonas sp. PAR7]MDT0511037.1 hypothetical protein [Halomonas sp. LES1]MDT0592446.1 hypothetical protein [Halomonas sp. PAR8]
MTEPSPKGGRLARQAAMLCQNPAFRLYLDRRKRHKLGMTEAALPDGTHSEQDARDWLCAACGIHSRAELDHSLEAGRTFVRVRTRFNQWGARNRVTNQRTGNKGP